MHGTDSPAGASSLLGSLAGALAVDIRLLSIPTLASLQTSRGEKGEQEADWGKAAERAAEAAEEEAGGAEESAGATRSNSAGGEAGGPANRQLVVVRFEDSDGSVGWGECSALNEIGYSNESAMSSFHALTGTRSPDPNKLPMAAAAIEMARLDLRLRKAGQSLAESLGVTQARQAKAETAVGTRREATVKAETAVAAKATVRAGAVLGLMPPERSVVLAGRLVKDGYRRIKVKISPDQVGIVPAVLRMTFPELEIQVDANGSLDESHMDQLIELAELGVTAIEQPFPVNRPELAAKLISRLADQAGPDFASSDRGTDSTDSGSGSGPGSTDSGSRSGPGSRSGSGSGSGSGFNSASGPTGRGDIAVAVVADEAAPTLEAAKLLLSQGALSGVSIKPPRLGGISRALELLAWCVGQGIPATAGGMLESALGRHSLAAFAANDGLSITGDVSPSRRWLAIDPWPDLQMSNGMIAVPTTPGVAPLPDQDLIEDLTVYRWTGRS